MGLLHVEQYLRPTSLEEAFRLKKAAGERAAYVGGGVSLVLFAPEVKTLVDLSRVPLDGIHAEKGGVRIGASAPMREVLDSPILQTYLGGIVPRMLREVASPLLRNVATVGGTLVAANPWSDVIPVLLSLDAEVTLFDGTSRTIPLSDLFPIRQHLGDALLTEVRLPPAPAHGAASFVKFSRTRFDVAMLNVACAVTVEKGRCSKARVVVGGRPEPAARAPKVEEVLVGAELSPKTIAAAAGVAARTVEVREDRRASAEYRKELVEVVVRRALTEAKARLAEGAQ